MSGQSARDALRAALADWRRHAVAVGLVVAGFALAASVGTPEARYLAALFAFSVWMAWFVLTAVEWIRHAEF